MNVFGVGAPELILILIIMLVVAGPQRMIQWSRILGRYVGQFRQMWEQMIDVVQKEFDEAGVDVKLPKEPPTRQSITDMVKQATKPISEPIEESLKEVQTDLNQLKTTAKDVNKDIKEINKAAQVNMAPVEQKPVKSPPKPPVTEPEKPSLGTWSGAAAPDKQQQNGASPFGTWSSHNQNSEE